VKVIILIVRQAVVGQYMLTDLLFDNY